jgi:hypothetical protein
MTILFFLSQHLRHLPILRGILLRGNQGQGLVDPKPTPTLTDSQAAGDLNTYFGNLTTDLWVPFVSIASFFFLLALVWYMVVGATNEQGRSHAKMAMYIILSSVILATIAKLLITILVQATPVSPQ